MLAKEVTIRVHSEKEYHTAVAASEVLFGKGGSEVLSTFSDEDLLGIMEGLPQYTIAKSELENGIDLLEFFAVKTDIFPSKGEARKMLLAGGLSFNNEKIEDINQKLDTQKLINQKYILARKGKKNYYLIIAE